MSVHNTNAITKPCYCIIWYFLKNTVKKVIIRAVEETLQDICNVISQRYEIKFLEIGSDEDHIHSLIQSVPNLSITRIVTILKSITAREIYKTYPEVKKLL